MMNNYQNLKNQDLTFIDFGFGYPQFIENLENRKVTSFPLTKMSNRLPISNGVNFLPPAIMKDEVFTNLSERYVPNTMDRYIISNYGRLYDTLCHRFVPFRMNKSTYTKDITSSNRGYCTSHVAYYKSPFEIGSVDIYIHRAVLMSFDYFPGCEKFQVNHKDGIHLNNTRGNLEWTTSDQNILHSVKNGLRDYDWNNYNNKKINIDEKDVDEICDLYIRGLTIKEISDKLWIFQNIVFKVLSGELMSNVSSKFSICISNMDIPVESIHKLCTLISKGIPLSDIAAMTGISKYELADIRDRRLYSDISRHYDFSKACDISDFRRTLTPNVVHEICRRLALGIQPVEIERDMNVDRSTIFNIRNKTIYREISTQYEFKNLTNDTLSDDIVKSICKDMETGMSSADIGRKYNISPTTIGHIRRGETYTNISKNYNINVPVLPTRPLSDETVHEICSRLQSGEYPTSIARDLNINVAAVNGIKQGRYYKDISKDYTFFVQNHMLPDDKVRAVCEALQRGDRLIDIINNTGVSKKTIYRIKNRELYHDITKDYNY